MGKCVTFPFFIKVFLDKFNKVHFNELYIDK
jgi:hypothetical protein